jgi:MOSC domain-containing protein YiiM
MTGRVLAIQRALPAEAEREAVDAVEAVPGGGLEGDRSHADITLIAQEALDRLLAETGIEFSHRESGRNVLTTGIDLNGLVGKRFKVGKVELIGVELCEPCRHLERSRAKPGVLRGLVHQGGLNADVLSAGTIRVGDEVSATGR